MSKPRPAAKRPPITYKSARENLSRAGMILLYTPWSKDYRVTFRRGTPQEREDRAYYTDDLTDAYRTGMVMAKTALPSELERHHA